MKERKAHKLVKRKLLITLLVSFLVFSGINYKANAQGWTFTFQVDHSGPCTGAPPFPIPALPNFGIPTKSQCEGLRQTLQTIRSSMPMYNDRGNYIGDCAFFVTCTPCTGSDIVTPGQVNPGDVSFDGQFQGKPLFTAHESSAFEDWSKDYRQQLESYGITSILGNTLTPPQIPLTGDPGFDAFYNNQTANFNPTTPAVKPPIQDASIVDLSGKKGVVQLLTTTEEQAKRDKWYEEKGFNNLTPITEAEGINENIPAERSWKEAALRTALGEADGLAGVIANFGMNVTDETFKGLNQAIGYVASGNDAKAQELGNDLLKGQVVFNSIKKTALDAVSDKLTDVGYVPLLKSVKGAEAVYKVSKIGVSLYENKHPDE